MQATFFNCYFLLKIVVHVYMQCKDLKLLVYASFIFAGIKLFWLRRDIYRVEKRITNTGIFWAGQYIFFHRSLRRTLVL